MADVLIRVDGVDLPNPSSLKWSKQSVSVGDSGRDDTGYMYAGIICSKIKLELQWNAVSPSVASQILSAFDPEYVNVRYFDAKENSWVVKEFYSGDKSAPVKMWTDGQKIYESLSFNIIER